MRVAIVSHNLLGANRVNGKFTTGSVVERLYSKLVGFFTRVVLPVIIDFEWFGPALRTGVPAGIKVV